MFQFNTGKYFALYTHNFFITGLHHYCPDPYSTRRQHPPHDRKIYYSTRGFLKKAAIADIP